MYGIFATIFHKNQPNVGKDTSHMDPIGVAAAFKINNDSHENDLFSKLTSYQPSDPASIKDSCSS